MWWSSNPRLQSSHNLYWVGRPVLRAVQVAFELPPSRARPCTRRRQRGARRAHHDAHPGSGESPSTPSTAVLGLLLLGDAVSRPASASRLRTSYASRDACDEACAPEPLARLSLRSATSHRNYTVHVHGHLISNTFGVLRTQKCPVHSECRLTHTPLSLCSQPDRTYSCTQLYKHTDSCLFISWIPPRTCTGHRSKFGGRGQEYMRLYRNL